MSRSGVQPGGLSLGISCRNLSALAFNETPGMWTEIALELDGIGQDASEDARLRKAFFLGDNMGHEGGMQQVSVGQILAYEIALENYGEKALDVTVQVCDRISDRCEPVYLENGAGEMEHERELSIAPHAVALINFTYCVRENGIHTLFCLLRSKRNEDCVMSKCLGKFEAILFLIVKSIFLSALPSGELLFSLSIMNVSQYVILIRRLEFAIDDYSASLVAASVTNGSINCSLPQSGRLQQLYKLTKLNSKVSTAAQKNPGSPASRNVVKVIWNTAFFTPVTSGITHPYNLGGRQSAPSVEFRVCSSDLSLPNHSSAAPSVILRLLVSNNSPTEPLNNVTVSANVSRKSNLIIPLHCKILSLRDIGPNEAETPCVEVIPLRSGLMEVVRLTLRFSRRGESDAPNVIIHKIHY